MDFPPRQQHAFSTETGTGTNPFAIRPVRTRLFACSLLFLSVLPGCSFSNRSEKGEETNPLLIRLGTAEIHLNEYLFYFKMNYPEVVNDVDPDLQSYIFDVFRKDILIAQISQILGFRITNDQVESFIKYKMTGKSIHLLPPGEQEMWRKEIQRRLAIQQFLEREILNEISIPDEEINAYYQSHQDQFKQEALYNIRFMQASSEDRAKAFLKKLKKTKGSFTEIAADYSENEGYRISTPLSLNDLLTPFQEAIRKIKPGQYTKIIPVKHGETTYHYVLYLESETPPTQIPYKEAYDHIRQELEKERSRALLDEKIQQFRNRIPTKVYWENLPFSYREASQRKEV